MKSGVSALRSDVIVFSNAGGSSGSFGCNGFDHDLVRNFTLDIYKTVNYRYSSIFDCCQLSITKWAPAGEMDNAEYCRLAEGGKSATRTRSPKGFVG
jgi:hypothetical protein